MAIEPKRLNGATLAYDTAASVDGDNDLIPVASAANAYKLAKVTPNVLAEAIGADALDAGIAAAAASTSLASTDFLAGQTAAGANIKATTDTLRTYFNTANGVTVVPATVTDGAGLQALIDARQTAGGGTVYLPEGRAITTTQTIQVPSLVHLQMAPGAEIIINADVHGVELRGCEVSQALASGSKLTGGQIRVAHTGYTKAALYLDGTRVGTGQTRFHRKGAVKVSGTIIKGRTDQNEGIGIYLRAVGDATNGASVQWVEFDGVNIIDFDDGVLLHAYEANASYPAFCNGNTFRGLFMQNCVNFWHYTCDGAGGGADGDISLNQHIGCTYQVSTTTEKLILVDGGSSGFCSWNYHIGMGVFDWDAAPAASTTAVDLANGDLWVFVGPGYLNTSHFSMESSNVIVGEQIRRHTGASLPADPEDWASTLRYWYDAANKRMSLLHSDGTRWLSLVGASGPRIDFTVGRTFTVAELASRQLWAQSISATDNPTIFDIGTNAFVGAEIHVTRRHASYPLRLNIGARTLFDPFAGTQSTAGQYLSLDTQYAEVILRCIENENWAIVFKKGTLSYVTP